MHRLHTTTLEGDRPLGFCPPPALAAPGVSAPPAAPTAPHAARPLRDTARSPRTQATRHNGAREERGEIIGCILALLLCLGVIGAFYHFTWSVFG